jgi:hypothetical protein
VKVKELALSDALTTAYLLLQDCRKLKTSLALELSAAKDDRVREADLMHEMRVTLTEIQAQFGIERRLLDLVRPETGRQNSERSETNTQ